MSVGNLLERGALMFEQYFASLDKKEHISLSVYQAEKQIKAKLKSDDLMIRYVPQNSELLALFYLPSITDTDLLQKKILPILQSHLNETMDAETLMDHLPVTAVKPNSDLSMIASSLTQGWTYIHVHDQACGLLIRLAKTESRSLSRAETEGQIFGSQVGFIEDSDKNLSLLRHMLPTPDLQVETLMLGERSPCQVHILRLKDLCSQQNVNTVRQRIEDLQADTIIDSATLAQLIDDNSYSVFPPLLLTERPDRTVSSLLEGKLVLLVSGSPFVIVGPCNFFDFFRSTEDQYLRWNMASFIRILRIFSLLISTLFTPAYVAALTFHYAVIPAALLVSIAQSRSKVPFPPIFEALMLELILELLKEAGARLPTKVGQTMSIVGGIVIGQAAVQAGFTSNILIMIVALGAIASFTTPSYMMGNALRLIRFPIIILAGLWGGIGIMAGICFLLLHLLKQRSLGAPYLYPVFPPRIIGMRNSLVRLPFSWFAKRANFKRRNDSYKFNPPADKNKNKFDK